MPTLVKRIVFQNGTIILIQREYAKSIPDNLFLVSSDYIDHKKYIGNLKPVETFTHYVFSYSPFDLPSIKT